MQRFEHNPLCAATAIAAVLALSSAPLAAQSAETAAPAPPPVVSAEPAPATPPPVPGPVQVIPAEPAVLPPIQPSPLPSAGVSPAAAATPLAAEPATAPSPKSSPALPRSTARPKAAPVAVSVDPAPTANLLPAAAASPPVSEPRAAPAPTPEQARDVTSLLMVVFLGLLAAAIALAGILAFRRCRPVSAKPAAAVTPVVPEAPRTAVRRDLVAVAVEAPPVAAPTILRRLTAPAALPSDGAAVDLPAAMPATYEERDALLKRMIEARPDKANPFTDRRARLHRARLIMQSLGRTFDRAPLIDLSQYPNNWPELARPRYRAA